MSKASHYRKQKTGYSLPSYFLGANSLRTLSTTDWNWCVLDCARNNLCVGFQFFETEKKCYLLATSPNNNVIFEPSAINDVLFYKISILEATPTTTGKNRGTTITIM